MAQAIELIKALTPLAWPLILGVILWVLFPTVKAIVTSRTFSVKIAGMEVNVQEATEQIRTQIADLQKQVMLLRSAERAKSSIPETIEASATRNRTKPLRVLWVDDNPSNNAFEIAQLQGRGVAVVPAASTDEAMEALKDQTFDAVISDMVRRERGGNRYEAGLALLKTLRRSGNALPFLIYTSQEGAEDCDQTVKSAGGDGATASPVELLEWVDRRININ